MRSTATHTRTCTRLFVLRARACVQDILSSIQLNATREVPLHESIGHFFHHIRSALDKEVLFLLCTVAEAGAECHHPGPPVFRSLPPLCVVLPRINVSVKGGTKRVAVLRVQR